MSDRVKLIQYKGKEILFVDYRNLGGEDYLRVISEFRDKLRAELSMGKDNILYLVDITDSVTGNEQYRMQIDLARDFHKNIKAVAVIGVEGFKRFFVNIASRILTNMQVFNDEVQAKDWLVNQ